MAHKVLIIDDDTHLREGLAEVLDAEGFSCTEAGNAKGGIDSAKKHTPDVVIMDIQLPDSSGFQICQELRRHSKEFVLIMMTGRFLSAEEKTQGFELGADEYITKPFDIQELSIRIRQLLSRKGK
ncbi:MAG: two-component system OmpR family alkaline phosphatase synthesis response regulator PhoP [Elusimicrobia bacterium]|nr:MAG: two-component system OmpR family alkaline phosphatase synthesis response regulator PhoP [Elusimicrobiota bacterium]KAF0157823.1 MAG: two-component system OmpR family alkaline phosphatase synthesis response regulator PhoP [Elusimicrobiota bacterium]